MTLPRYPAYKDSGVEWLGELPNHWGVGPLKRMVSIQNGADHKSIEVDIGYPVIGSGGAFAYASDYLYEGESVLFGRKGTIDKPLYVKGRFWTVDTMYWSRILPAAHGRFCYYVALTIPYGYYSTSTALPSMTKGDLNSHLVPFPPVGEQTDIASFLDHETSRIDALIAEQQNLIALLKEKRQAVISHAVTKGLNPDAPMKDSGLEWLGEMPEHWRLGPLKYFVLSRPGAIKTGPFGSQLTSAEMEGGPIKVFTQRQVIDNDFVGEKFISEEKFSRLASFRAFPGDLLVTTRGTIGRAAILPPDSGEGVLHPCVLRVQADRDTLDSHYLWRLVQDSHLLKTQIDIMSNATTIEVIYSETMANLLLPVPPKEEQLEINAFLDQLVGKLDLLISQAELAIGLLQERRSALISAAVTGKIDVRGLVSQEAA